MAKARRAQSLGLEQAEVEGGVDLEVLHMKPGSGAADAGGKQRRDGAEQGRLDGEDDVRFPAALPQHGDRTAERKAGQVQHALEAGDLRRHPQGAAQKLDAVDGLAPVAPGRVAGADAPLRVVGRRADNLDLVPALHEPARHLAGVLADADGLGWRVQPVDEDAHWGLDGLDPKERLRCGRNERA